MVTILWISAIAVVAIYAMWWSLYGTARRRRLRMLAATLPGPPAWPIIGNALVFMANPEDLLNIILDYMKQYGEYTKFWLGPDLAVCVKNPADIRFLLTSNKINQKGPLYEFMKVFVGTGVLSEGGPVWRNHRKIAAPSYSKKTVQRYASVFNNSAEELADVLTKKDPSKTFNVYFDVVECTTLSVCQAVIGLSREESKNVKSMNAIVKESHDMYDFIFTNMTRWWLHIPLVYWLLGRKTTERRYIKIVDEMTSHMVAMRRRAMAEATPEELSVVDRFILSGDMTEQDIKWETMTFFTASQEASAKIASTALLILAHLPEWQGKVYSEILETLGPEDGYVSDEQLKNLAYLDAVYKEAVRYMPIAAFIQRTVEEEISINNGKVTLPVGASVIIPIHALHRDPRYWQSPDDVDPARFLPENMGTRDPNAFVPFSLGAMDCIGRVFAESMIKIMLIRVLRRVQLEADGRMEDLDLSVAISVKFAKGYNLRTKPRTPRNGVVSDQGNNAKYLAKKG